MSVELTLDEKPGPLHLLAGLDIVVLVMLLGFVVTGLVHRAGVSVTMGRSDFRVAVDEDAVLLTVKGIVEPVLYLDSRRVAENDLRTELRRLHEEKKVEMILLQGDVRLAAQVQNRLSEVILSEGLKCVWLAEPTSGGTL